MTSPIISAQAPVSDLTQYPSGLASIAVVCYYAIASDKDNLPHRRRTAGFGAENLARDLAHGPKTKRDAKIKGITCTRKKGVSQRTAWQVRVVGDNNRRTEMEVDILNRKALLESSVGAFGNLSMQAREAMQARSGFREEGIWLVAAAAFHQVVRELNGAKTYLERCKMCRNDEKEMRKIYQELRVFIVGKTNAVEMPDITDITGKRSHELKKLYVSADTWEGGGRPAYISCADFIKVFGYCVDFSYGELMAAAHYKLDDAPWSGCLYIEFLEELNSTATEDEIAVAMSQALKECVFFERACDVRVWGHRFGDYMASLVSGCLIACLVSLGSTCGTWVAVTASAVADPKPVSGPSSAAWGYPVQRLAHLEARSRSGAPQPKGCVCLKSTSAWKSFRGGVEQDWCYQVASGLVSLAVLVAKYPLRSSLGFGPFAAPQVWVTWLGIAATGLGTLITIQIPWWAFKNGGKWSFVHGLTLLAAELTTFVLRVIWFTRRDTVESQAMRSFWMADGVAWFHNVVGSLFSIHLNESTEYPVTGWLWPTTWLLAIATAGAGVPRKLSVPK
ncbi:hypothetical protein G6011_01274 [Alternaria panax]|uniref:Uncharacterized protein n=1 Tax=Alternaria panax TaxID=48097 RepID=A0AAD4IKL9_9PLEO|nr:hypothetical protein G6011_01274 [Alternaria panax]